MLTKQQVEDISEWRSDGNNDFPEEFQDDEVKALKETCLTLFKQVEKQREELEILRKVAKMTEELVKSVTAIYVLVQPPHEGMIKFYDELEVAK